MYTVYELKHNDEEKMSVSSDSSWGVDELDYVEPFKNTTKKISFWEKIRLVLNTIFKK